MAQGQADFVLSLVTARRGAHRHDVPICVSGSQGLPQIRFSCGLVFDYTPGSTIKSPDSVTSLSTSDVRVVSVQLGKGFL